MMKTASRYAPNSIASAKKHIYSRLIDYFLTFIITVTLFAIMMPISMNTSIYQNVSKEYASQRRGFYEFINETGILRLNAAGTDLLSVGEEAESYVQRVAKTSAYVHNVTFPKLNDDGTYSEVAVDIKETFIYERETYRLDNISHYFQKYKHTQNELNDYLIDGVHKKYEELTPSQKDDYQYKNIMEVTTSNFVSSDNPDYIARGGDVSTYVVLSEQMTEKIKLYYKNDRNDTSLHQSIFNSFIKGTQKAINDVEVNSHIYKNIESKINIISQKYSRIQIVVYMLCYVVSYLLLNILVALFSKEWITVGQKVMGLALCEVDEMEPPVWKYLIFHGLSFFGFSSSAILSFVLLGNIGVTSLKVFPHISFLAIMIFILTLNIFSLFMPLFNKKNYDLSTFFVKIVHKDKHEFDVPVGMDISDKVEEDGKQQD